MNSQTQDIGGGRRILIILFVSILFIILAFSFFRLQVLNKDKYVQKSLDNSIRAQSKSPVRGLILDNKGRILVDNTAAFSVAITPKVFPDSLYEPLANMLNMDTDRMHSLANRHFGFRPVPIARDVDTKILIRLEENRLQYPGVQSVLEPKRYYRPGVGSPHIFGSLGEVTLKEEKVNPNFDPGDIVGKSGLEKAYDSDLRGKKGLTYFRVDASGRELGLFDPEQDVPPVHGEDLHLIMDYAMQQFAESLMVDMRGALVALDPSTGGVLAMVSKPDFDPGILSGKISSELWNKLINDPARPLYNRAIQSVYPPGSTYKIVAALAALQDGLITPNWQSNCPGYFKIGRKTIHCWKKNGHGTVNLYEAIRGSCNVYFYKLGLKIGLDSWSKYSRLFRFGSLTGIDLPNESAGLVPSKAFFDKRYGLHGWTRGNLANLAIGQGELLVTPLQLAQFAMILANKGTYYTPHFVDYKYDYATGDTIRVISKPEQVQTISPDNFDAVREGMRRVVDGGTGWLGKVPGIEMAGKTGSSQNPHGKSHAWFMTFAPLDTPRVAIAVIVENGGGGGAVAAPIARKFMEKFFYGHIIPRKVIKKEIPQEDVAIDSLIAPIDINSISPIKITIDPTRDNHR